MIATFAVALILCATTTASHTGPSVVSRDDACFLGRTVRVGTDGRVVNAYTGIAYAEDAEAIMTPPVYLESYPAGRRTIVDACSTGFVAPQMHRNGDGSSEISHLLSPSPSAVQDPLRSRTLDVFVPADATPASIHPVVVFLHGGFNVSGSRAAGLNIGSGLLRDVDRAAVVVVVEYSLGPLGFWYDPTEPLASNIAVQEIVAALRWVHDRIADFGGDPERVSLAGHSAGAALAQHVHIALRSASGFFRQPIRTLVLMSGTALLLPAVSHDDAVQRQVQFGKLIPQCTGITDPHLLRLCLQKAPFDQIRRAGSVFPIAWTPAADGAVLPALPTDVALEAGLFTSNVRVVSTVMHDDAAFFVDAVCESLNSHASDDAGPRHKAPRVELGVASVLAAMGVPHDVAAEISAAYTSGDARRDLTDVLTDAFFMRPAQRVNEYYSAHGLHAGLAVLTDTLDRIDAESLVGRSAELVAKSRAADGLRSVSAGLSSTAGLLGRFGGRVPEVVRQRLDRSSDSINEFSARVQKISASAEKATKALRRLQSLGAMHGLEQCILFDAVALRVQEPHRTLTFRMLVSAKQPRAVCVFHAAIAADEVPSDHVPRSNMPVARLDAIDMYAIASMFLNIRRS